jgi:hypothetical protein
MAPRVHVLQLDGHIRIQPDGSNRDAVQKAFTNAKQDDSVTPSGA